MTLIKQLTAFIGLVILTSGCATTTPVGVTTLGRNSAYEQIDRNAMNSREFSGATASVLYRYDLDRVYEKSPVRCLVQLHEIACSDDRRDPLFALAEVAFMIGNKNRKYKVDGRTLAPENFYAASAVYAYLFLHGSGHESAPDAFDRRFRIACDLYNRSLGFVIAQREGKSLSKATEWLLPVGRMTVKHDAAGDFDLPLIENETFVSADRLKIRGLSVRNRIAGMGSPIILVGDKQTGAIKTSTAAATVFLKVEGSVTNMADGTLQTAVEIYSAFSRNTVEVDGREIPLEQDLTTQIAYALNNPVYWKVEKMLFRLGQSPFDPGIYMAQPYKKGKIPVLFVHGTMSSPVWWAEMWNTLMGDPTLREAYQFWFYLYDSAKPVTQSAVHLRKSILDKVGELDSEGNDPTLRQMVVIGHSQGGLLTKLTVTRTGEALVQAATGKTIEELKLAPEDEKLVRELAIFEPLPEVKRVVFISTPHRGSYLAGGFVRKLARRFLALPKRALETTTHVLNLAPKIGPNVKLASTSIDSMSPDNPAMLALADIPVAPPIKSHSIIAIDGDDVPPKGGDGVVKYTSAHIAGVESELIVRSTHSCQGKPPTIEEVRRILLEHLADAEPSVAVGADRGKPSVAEEKPIKL